MISDDTDQDHDGSDGGACGDEDIESGGDLLRVVKEGSVLNLLHELQKVTLADYC
jgi:hypothetical protein